MRLLLISNSYSYRKSYLDHCIEDVAIFLGNAKRIMFIPYALHDLLSYSELAARRFAEFGCEIISIHLVDNPKQAIRQAEGIFIGGGNTFRLLKVLYEEDLISSLRTAVVNKTPYIGTSAGAVIAGPTIKTTNDMPIVYPPSLAGLSLVPFHINPHYFDPDPKWKLMMETREQRIRQFHEENDSDVLGLREDSYILVENDRIILKGYTGGKLFRKGEQPQDLAANSDLTFLSHETQQAKK